MPRRKRSKRPTDKNPYKKKQRRSSSQRLRPKKSCQTPQKRSLYDRLVKEPRHRGRAASGAHSPSPSPEEIFREFFVDADFFATDNSGGDFELNSLGPGEYTMDSRRMIDSSGRHHCKSVSTCNKVISGRQIIARKIIENGQERIEVEEDGQLKFMIVNGREVPISVQNRQETA